MKKLMPLMLPEVFFTDHKLANTTKDGTVLRAVASMFFTNHPKQKE
jgi:hypothetical protein